MYLFVFLKIDGGLLFVSLMRTSFLHLVVVFSTLATVSLCTGSGGFFPGRVFLFLFI